MESFRLSPDGHVPREMTARYGLELTSRERMEYKIFGIGFFRPLEDKPNILSQWFELKNFTIRPHLDQLTNGLIFRLRGTKELDALAITFEEISAIHIKRFPDEVNAPPFSLFWLLIKFGFPPRKIRFLTRYGYRFADVEVTIHIDEQEPIVLRWNGRHDHSVYRFFGSKFLKDKVRIEVMGE